jgi:hypothetical protein
MTRFVLNRYRRLIIGTTVAIASIELAVMGLQGDGVASIISQWLLDWLPLWGIAPFFVMPLIVTVHAFSSPKDCPWPMTAVRAWYMGVTVNLCVGFPVALAGIVGSALDVTSSALSDAQTLYLALGTVLGFVVLLWVGAIMGWAGFLLSRLTRKTA